MQAQRPTPVPSATQPMPQPQRPSGDGDGSGGGGGLSPQQQKLKQQVLTRPEAAATAGIADAVVVKDRNLFLMSRPDGTVPPGEGHGLGMYHHDCRFLNGYRWQLSGTDLEPLGCSAPQGFEAVFQLCNRTIRLPDGRTIPRHRLGLRCRRAADGSRPALYDRLTVENFALEPFEVELTLEFGSAFEDVFAVRGLLPEHPGDINPPEWRDGALQLSYRGADGVHRATTVFLTPPPDAVEPARAVYRLSLAPKDSREIQVSILPTESADPERIRPRSVGPADVEGVCAARRSAEDKWMAQETRLRTDSVLLDKIIGRSLRDLHVLRSRLGREEFFSAGIPWFDALFGRDSVITALQTLAFGADTAEETLRVLAGHQGDRLDEWRDEQPGKILHEYRRGELARIGQIPHTPYYGTVDATPLFLILIGRHAAWTGRTDVFESLRGNVERALEWIDRWGDTDGDGFVDYRSRSERGLVNQGWKDSGNAIVDADGRLAEPPIAMVEVQGYVYRARLEIADLFERTGDAARAAALRRQAAELRDRFNRDFWLDDKGVYALALQAGGRPAAVVSSNPGHALWAGIAEPQKARRTRERLTADDMFSGWGIRTLAESERAYSPISYHRGTVWPHDNSIIAAGFKAYGFDTGVVQVADGILDAAAAFDDFVLPEAFAGFSRRDYAVPIRYPVACHPQAWAAGSVPHLLETMLGLEPDGFAGRLRIVRPTLPHMTDCIEVSRMKVGRGRADLAFERTPGGVGVRVLRTEGDLQVEVDGAPTL